MWIWHGMEKVNWTEVTMPERPCELLIQCYTSALMYTCIHNEHKTYEAVLYEVKEDLLLEKDRESGMVRGNSPLRTHGGKNGRKVNEKTKTDAAGLEGGGWIQ